MKHKFLLFLTTLLIISCNKKTEQSEQEHNNNVETKKKTRILSFSEPFDKSGLKEIDFFLAEISDFYPEKYECSSPEGSIIRGDINKDGNEDILFRYSVDDVENRAWVACGWFVAFSKNKKEFENFVFYDWSSGSGGAPTQFDFGFPNAIKDGIIYSEIDDYKENDASCCPSIKRKMTFSFDKELGLMSLLNMENLNN